MRFKKQFHDAVTAIVRNRFLSAITIISIAFILLIFNVLLAVNQVTHQTVQNLSEKITLTVYVNTNTSQDDLEPILNDINELNFVTNTNYETAGQSFEKITSKYPETTKFLDKYNVPNPLPATVNITTTNLEDQKRLIKLFQNEPYNKIFRVDANEQQRSTIRKVIDNLINFKRFTFQVVLWVLITFTIGGALLIFNVLNVTLFSRRKEIQIMQFVGATHSTIRIPFVIEGVLYGLISFILSLIIFLIAYQFLPEALTGFRATILSGHFQLTLLIELVAVSIISGIISILTVENYLKNKTILG